MGNDFRDPVDHARTTRPRAGESIKDGARFPGLILVGAGVVAFVFGLAAFAMGRKDVGVVAAIIAALAAGGGFIWLALEGRRVRRMDHGHDTAPVSISERIKNRTAHSTKVGGHKAESDVEAETHQARTRASEHDDGSYVGRTFKDEAFDVGETGAEARSKSQ